MKALTTKQKAFEILEGGFDGSTLSKVLSGFIIFLIVTNVIAVVIESYAPIAQKYHQVFYVFNIFSVVIFSVEYLARLWACTESPNLDSSTPLRSRIKYIFSPISLIDLIAIAPFYLAFILPIDLRYLRMLRMLRLLKLTHYFKGLRLFANVLKQELPSIGAAIFIMGVLVILSASIIYSVEHAAQPTVFDSIPSAIWWSVVTMTTVGYGDVTPVTFLGKFIAIFIMLLGVGVVALPAAMLAARFGEELRTKKENLEHEIETALADGVVSQSEKLEIEALANTLGISMADLEKMINSHKKEQEPQHNCPNCGHKFDS